MMTLDQAIQHCAEKEAELRKCNKCSSCADEHHQLMEWLQELKARREADNTTESFESISAAYESKLSYEDYNFKHMVAKIENQSALYYKKTMKNALINLDSAEGINNLIIQSNKKVQNRNNLIQHRLNKYSIEKKYDQEKHIESANRSMDIIAAKEMKTLKNTIKILNKMCKQILKRIKKSKGDYIYISNGDKDVTKLEINKIKDGFSSFDKFVATSVKSAFTLVLMQYTKDVAKSTGSIFGKFYEGQPLKGRTVQLMTYSFLGGNLYMALKDLCQNSKFKPVMVELKKTIEKYDITKSPALKDPKTKEKIESIRNSFAKKIK